MKCLRVMLLLGLIVFFVQDSFGKQITQPIKELGPKKKSIFAIDPAERTATVSRCYHRLTSLEPLSVLSTVISLCEKKYPELRKELAVLSVQVAQKETLVEAKKRKVKAEYFERFQRLDIFSGGPDSHPSVNENDIPPVFQDSPEVKKYLQWAEEFQRDAVRIVLGNTPPKLREILVRERARYLAARIGVSRMLSDKAVSDHLHLNRKQCLEIAIFRKQHFESFRIEMSEKFKKSCRSVFRVLNENQILKLERRLGVSRDELVVFLDYKLINRFVADMEVSRTYKVIEESGKVVEFSGVTGLKALSKKLPSDIVVRYHVSEISPTSKRKTKLQRIVASNYGMLVNEVSPINDVKVDGMQRPYGFDLNSFLWEFEPSDQQVHLLSRALGNLKSSKKLGLSIEEQIEINNQLFEELDDLMIRGQGVSMFRAFFRAHGPVGFFFLPGVAGDFELSDRQLKRLQANGKEASKAVLLSKNDIVRIELQALKSSLTANQINELRRLLDMPIKMALEQRLEFLMKKDLDPIDKTDFNSYEKLSGCFRPAISAPKIYGF